MIWERPASAATTNAVDELLAATHAELILAVDATAASPASVAVTDGTTTFGIDVADGPLAGLPFDGNGSA